MAKGIIVVDMPESCNQCQFYYPARNMHTGKYMGGCKLVACMVIRDKNGKPDWCPINPIPERQVLTKDVSNTTKIGEELVRVGFNACLDEIEGKM